MPSAERVARRGAAVAVVVVAAAVIAGVLLLAVVHVDDRYGVSAASGVYMGLASALQGGVLYPAVYANGFYGGTRYMPLPFMLQSGGAWVSGELLVSAKLLVYGVATALYVLVFAVARRRGAPSPVALGLVGAILATAAGLMTTVALRWDALATLLQVGAVAVVVGHERSRRRAALAGVLCTLALLSKLSAVWALVALVVWLALNARRSLAVFLGAFAVATLALGGVLTLLSSGRMWENMRLFAFGGGDAAGTLDGVHRLYQFAIRDQREAALLVLLAAVGVVVAVVRRRAGPYEIGLVACALALLVVMRDAGAYENHLLDLVVLAAIVVAGMWTSFASALARRIVHAAVVVCIVAATILAVRYTIEPDIRAAFGDTAATRYALHPLGTITQGCVLYEDASYPILDGKRPVVLDAFMLHRLQTRRPAELDLLDERVRRGEFRHIVLTRTLDDLGWFAVLDFGSKLAGSMREHYRLARTIPEQSLWIYVPKKVPAAAACRATSIGRW